MNVNNRLITFVFFIFVTVIGFCHEIPDSSSSGEDNALPLKQKYKQADDETSLNYSSLIFSFDYSSNTNTFGNFNTGSAQPFYSPSVSFFSKSGFDISILPAFIDNSDVTSTEMTSELDLMAGYNFHPAKNLSIYPGYTHIFYSKNSYSLKSVISDIIQMDMTYQLNWYSPSLSVSYLIGKKNTFYASLENSFSIDFEKVPGKNALLSLQPGFDLNFSDINYYNDLLLTDYLNSAVINYLVERWLTRFPWLTDEQIKTRLYNYELQQNPNIFDEQYSLTTISLMLPVYYMTGNFSFNLTLYSSVPVNESEFLSSDIQFYLNAGVSYSIDFLK